MTPERLERIRKSWEPHRGYIDWANRRSFVLDVPARDDGQERVQITADDVGYLHADGRRWEWWNIIAEGHIIDAERYESRHGRFARENVF